MHRLDDALREAYLCQMAPLKTLAVGVLGEVLAHCGRTAEARETIQQLDRMGSAEYVDPLSYTLVYGGLGDWDSTLMWLERAVDQHSTWAVFAAQDPRFDPVRRHPRFQRCLTRMNLL